MALMTEDYVRNALVLKVIDGDTLELNIDLGFRIWHRTRIRLLGVDCPEMTGPTKNAGQAAKVFTETWLQTVQAACVRKGLPILVQVATHLDKTDSFGRLLGYVSCQESSLNDELIRNGHAIKR